MTTYELVCLLALAFFGAIGCGSIYAARVRGGSQREEATGLVLVGLVAFIIAIAFLGLWIAH